jgi:phage replication O-like protein O
VLPIFSFIVRTFDMDDQARIPAPNYTQIPNAVLDLMADMGEAELRVVLAIARQTFGWHKKRDKISLSQLTKLTGMSRPAVVNGLKAGIERGLIDRTPDPNDGRGGIWYHLLVNEVNQSSTLTSNQLTTLTRTSNPTLPELVNEVNTQKKEKERKERGGVQLPPTLELYAQLTGIRPAQFAADMITAQVTDLRQWEKVIKDWLASGFKPANVKGMLDWYHGKGRHQGNGSAHPNRTPADLPLVTAAPRQTPEERAAQAARHKAILDERKAR